MWCGANEPRIKPPNLGSVSNDWLGRPSPRCVNWSEAFAPFGPESSPRRLRGSQRENNRILGYVAIRRPRLRERTQSVYPDA